MTFWQENYGFVKDVYDFRLQKYQEWMDNLEAIVSKVMAPNVQYTYKEFKNIQDSLTVSITQSLSPSRKTKCLMSPVTFTEKLKFMTGSSERGVMSPVTGEPCHQPHEAIWLRVTFPKKKKRLWKRATFVNSCVS